MILLHEHAQCLAQLGVVELRERVAGFAGEQQIASLALRVGVGCLLRTSRTLTTFLVLWGHGHSAPGGAHV